MIVRVTKLKEVEKALNPNNIDEGFQREFVHPHDQYFEPPTVDKRWWPDPAGTWSTSGVQEIIDANTFRTYSSIYRWEIIKEEDASIIVALTLSSANDRYHFGMDGQYFQIPLSKELKPHDVITLNPELKISPLIVVDEPITYHEETVFDGSTVKYWLHTVKLYTQESNRFFPGKYLRKGTTFKILK